MLFDLKTGFKTLLVGQSFHICSRSGPYGQPDRKLSVFYASLIKLQFQHKHHMNVQSWKLQLSGWELGLISKTNFSNFNCQGLIVQGKQQEKLTQGKPMIPRLIKSALITCSFIPSLYFLKTFDDLQNSSYI